MELPKNTPQIPVTAAPTAAPHMATGQATAKLALPVKNEAKSNARFIVGCLSAFGCSVVLFLVAVFAFLGVNSPENPIFRFLGVPPSEVVNFLIMLISMIFLGLIFVAFIFLMVGVFRLANARKDDAATKKKGALMIFAALASIFILVLVWVSAYFFLAGKRTAAIKADPIASDPAVTTNLTAPVSVQFDAKNVPVARGQYEILAIDWDFGDDSPRVRGELQTHTFTKVGTFHVIAGVSRRDKRTRKEDRVEFEKVVTIANVTATVAITATPNKGPSPLTVAFDGSKSHSENGEITSYSWDLDGDGIFTDAEGKTASKTFEKIGTYKVALRVTDSTQAYATGETSVTVIATEKPAAAISIENVSGTNLFAGTPYVFSGADSVSPSGRIEKYEWKFGDGATAQTRIVNHTYKDPGDYEVTLTVTDDAKRTAQSTIRYRVNAAEATPVPVIKTTPAAANNVVAGQAPFEVIFDATQTTDANGDIVQYAWDFDGDGTSDATDPIATHRYAESGNRTVTLTVTDAANHTAKAQVAVSVTSPGLRADIKAEPVSGIIPLSVAFDASGSSYADSSIVGYEWDFGDGSTPRIDTAKVTYQYTKIGTFTAKVTAIAADSKRASAQVPITVRPVALKACFTASSETGRAPLIVEFDPTCSAGTVVKYRWKFGELGAAEERKPRFTFQDAGTYEVKLEVADNENVIDSYVKTISITQ